VGIAGSSKTQIALTWCKQDQVSEMKRLNIGIIGLGFQGGNHFRNCLRLEDAKLAGVADVSESTLMVAKKAGVKDVYTNYENLLKDKKIDAVIISLPNFLHRECATKAAEAGKNILLEKPLARNAGEGEEILSSVRQNGVKLMLGYDLRFNTILNNIHDQIIDGFFGEVQLVEASIIGGGPFSSRSDRIGPVQVPSWWFDKELVGGGALLDLGSHLINLLTWYFGEVIDVKSHLGYLFNMEVEDIATCMMRFKDGPVATIKAGWFSKDSIQTIQIYGTARNVIAKIAPSGTIAHVWKDIEKKMGWRKHDPYYLELVNFLECLRKNEEPRPSGDEGLRDLRIISMAYKKASEP
jgi:predicted dehydrogenase